MTRLSLCCLFVEQPLKYRTVTAARLNQFSRTEQLEMVSEICLHNVETLFRAMVWLASNNILGYRVPSPIFPRFTHPEVGYTLDELPDGGKIMDRLAEVRRCRSENNIRLSLHPDQFNVLSSPNEEVVDNTIRELEYQGLVAELIGAEVINIHGGGGYGDKGAALNRFRDNFSRLSDRVQSRLTLENDDRIYTVEDLLPLCDTLGRPLVYDIHHHRCLPDALNEVEATNECLKTWRKFGAEAWFHISSPANGWNEQDPRPHAEYIDVEDFPALWSELSATIDVEAKAKELAVLKLQKDLTEHYLSRVDAATQHIGQEVRR